MAYGNVTATLPAAGSVLESILCLVLYAVLFGLELLLLWINRCSLCVAIISLKNESHSHSLARHYVVLSKRENVTSHKEEVVVPVKKKWWSLGERESKQTTTATKSQSELWFDLVYLLALAQIKIKILQIGYCYSIYWSLGDCEARRLLCYVCYFTASDANASAAK